MIETGVVNGRFQVLHLKHMEYILAAKMRCRKLYIGLTNPDGRMTGDSVNDQNRSTKAANPLTYFERYEMIKGAMRNLKSLSRNMIFCRFRLISRNILQIICRKMRRILWDSVMRGMKKNIRSCEA